MKKCVQVPIEDYINNYEPFRSKANNDRKMRGTIPAAFAKMLRDLSERNLDKRIYEAIVEYAWESIQLLIEKENTVRFVSATAKSLQDRETPLYGDVVL